MKFNKFFLLFIFFVWSSKSISQNYELGKVTIAELQEKRHPKDSTANAAILFKKGEVNFQYNDAEEAFFMYTIVKVKVKIYKKEGFNEADQFVSYYIGGEIKDVVNFENAITYNLVEGKIEKTKLKKEGEFDENINKKWNRKKITMPNIKEGSIIEFQYTLKSKRIGEMNDWYFQSNIPVNYSEFKTSVPEYFVYKSTQRGFVFPKVEVEKKPKTVAVNYRLENSNSGSYHRSPASSFGGYKFSYLETKSVYTAYDLPAMKEEGYVNNINNYTSAVSNELESVQYPNTPLELFSTDWKSVTKTIHDDSDFGQELEKTNYFESDLNLILKGLTTPEEKIITILNFVKTKVKWDNSFGIFCSKGVKKAYTDKTGNVAEINLMLTSMLRYAGLEANPVLISTRSNGIAFYPTIAAFNYVVSAVDISGELVLLDATEKYSNINVLPFRDLNWIGRLVKKDGTTTEIDLMPKKLSNDVVTLNYIVNATGLVSGKVRRQMSDYNALLYRNRVEDVVVETYLEKLENEYDKIEIKDYQRTNEKDINLPVSETFSFTSSNSTEVIGGKIYINPMLFYSSQENPFKQEVREYPVDFGFPFMDKYAINIQIPEGFKIESMPASSNFSTVDNIGSFKIMTSTSGNTIQVSIVSQMNTPIVSSEYYAVLKEFYKTMIDKQNEKIVLIKI
ncbi:MAG: hypothetical protein RLZZ529_726 [Bacteroidota bacterium]|jgi:Domain of Unknown Function with PDB structure (DUF3857)